eukprot:4063354-Pleurochrysis_carterae.AAC.1
MELQKRLAKDEELELRPRLCYFLWLGPYLCLCLCFVCACVCRRASGSAEARMCVRASVGSGGDRGGGMRMCRMHGNLWPRRWLCPRLCLFWLDRRDDDATREAARLYEGVVSADETRWDAWANLATALSELKVCCLAIDSLHEKRAHRASASRHMLGGGRDEQSALGPGP